MRAVLFTSVAIGLICGVGLLDLATGTRASLNLLYVAVVGWTAWRGGYRAAFLTSLLAAAWWLFADLAQNPSYGVALSAWNAATRLTIFVVVGVFVRRLHDVQLELRDANERLSQRLAVEARFARTDMLTGLKNRTGFLETIKREIARSSRAGTPFGVLYLDLDNFKRVNDLHGHAEGDRALRLVASTLRRAIRATDVPARLGGDEFAVYCWIIGATAIEELAERLVTRTRALADEFPGADLGASIGVAWFGTPPRDEEEVLTHADSAMYAAKRGGKNRFRVIEGGSTNPSRPGNARLIVL